MDFPTFLDLFRVARDEVLVRSSQLTLDAVERDGSDSNILLATSSAVADEVVGQLVDVEAGVFLDSASGQALDKLVFDRTGIVRKAAAPGIGSVQFSTTAPNPAAFTITANVILQTTDGIQYITTSTELFPLLSTGPITVPIRSVLAGSNQQAQQNTITNIVTSIPGSPTDLVCTNVLATAGADDAESDADLRSRARQFFLTLRKATIPALEAGALAVPGVRRATAIEVIDVLGRPARLVQLVVADAFTDALVNQGVDPPAYQLQSQQLTLAVFAALSDVRAAGINVQVFVAQLVLQTITLRLRFHAGVNVDLVALTARATVVATVNGLSPGDTLSVSALESALQTVTGLDWQGDEIVSPAGDVVPQALQVIRTSLALTNASALQTDSSAAVLTGTINPDAFIVAGLGLG